MRRIVVTSMEAITSFAGNVEMPWSHLLAGRSGLRRLADEVGGFSGEGHQSGPAGGGELRDMQRLGSGGINASGSFRHWRDPDGGAQGNPS